MSIELKCKGPCGEWKDQHEFALDPTTTNGRRGTCKVCRAAYCRTRREQNRKPDKRARDMERTTESAREAFARELCSAVQSYWHIGEHNPRFGVAMIGGGYV